MAVAFIAAGLLMPAAQAQAPAALPTHAVRSIDPADTDFRDLSFLKAEIGPARVVMLGEPSHGEGNVFEAKIRLLRYLREQMGFTTVAFESGFYDLHKAQQALEAGTSAQEAIGNSVFPIWTGAQEFQAILPLVGKGGLRVAGFDPQLTGEYSDDMVDDLEAFLAPQKGAAALINYDYLEQVIGFMGEHFSFVPTTTLPEFEQEMAKVSKLVDKAAAGSDAKRRTEAAFWQQCLRSLLAQARDYAINDPGSKNETTFKAPDSNPRDAQMADNLLWYLRQHPQEKVVCWAALPHLANRTDHFDTAELQEYRPMGRAVKDALGPDQVYILGTLGGSGTCGFMFQEPKPVPAPIAGSLEAELLAQPADYAFVSLKHDAAGRRLTTYAFDYQPMTAVWNEAVDGFLFLRRVNPPHGGLASPIAGAAADSAQSGRALPTALNPAARPQRIRTAGAGATGAAVRGVVLDRKTGRPVPYASVSVPGQGVGTVADGEGRFVLRTAGGLVQISSVGYAAASVQPDANGALLTVRLVSAAYELQAVQVQGESLDPRKIMKKVLAALPKNYEQEDYLAEVYTRRRVSNFDTLRYESEYVSQSLEPAGHSDFNNGFLGMGPGEQHRVQAVRVLTGAKTPLRYRELMISGQGFLAAAADPVRIAPLFKAGRWKKYNLRLDSVQQAGSETVFVVAFAVKRATHRSTGTYLMAAYTGRIYVQQRDYAVVRYEALWQTDTVTENAVARQHAGRHDRIAPLYNTIFTDSRTDHAVDYERGANGRYHVAHSTAQGIEAGRVLGHAPHYRQVSCEEYFKPLPAGTALQLVNPSFDPRIANSEIFQLFKARPTPEFWQTYKRPTAR